MHVCSGTVPSIRVFQTLNGGTYMTFDQHSETLPGGVRTSRLTLNLPEVSLYIPEVISELYTSCTEHCGPPKVNRIAKA